MTLVYASKAAGISDVAVLEMVLNRRPRPPRRPPARHGPARDAPLDEVVGEDGIARRATQVGSFVSADPLCIATWSVVSLSIWYWGSSLLACTV